MKKLLAMLLLTAFAWTSYAQLSTEGFNGAAFPPTGWTTTPASSGLSFTWVTAGTYPTTSPYSGTGMVKINSFNYSTGTALLVSPPLNLTANPTYSVSFWMYRDGGYATSADKIDVMVNTSASTTGATNIGTVNRSMTLPPVVGALGWYQYTFTIPGTFTGPGNYVLFVATTAYGNNMYLDDVALPFAAPGIAAVVSPVSGGTGVLTTASLNWTAPTSAGPIYGYKLYFGTDSPPSNIVNGTDLGNVLTYDPTPDMNTSTVYRWMVVPYNAAGNATGAPVWSFTTLAGFGNLQGYIYDCSGAAVAGATVAVQGSANFSTTSGADGKYVFANIPADTYTLGATKNGYNTVTIPGVVVAASATTDKNVTLTQPNMVVTPTPYNVAVNPNELLAENFLVNNTGCGPVTYSASIGGWSSSNHTWLSLPTLTGTVAATSNANVPAMFNADGLTVGTVLSAVVTFTSNPNVGTVAIPVNMVVAGATLAPVTNLNGVITNLVNGSVKLTWDCTPGAGFQFYTVKRGGVQVAVIPTATTFSEILPAYGSYNYCVDAVYNDGTTAPVCALVEWPNPAMSWTPSALAATVWSNTSKMVDLTLHNTGLGTLIYEFPDYSDNQTSSPLAYCAAGSTTNDEFISRVQFGTINNASAAYPAGGYSNFTAISTDLEMNIPYPISVSVGPPSYTGDITGVWIDYNQNSTFDAAEFTALSGVQATGNITVPMSALAGPTTMRVRLQYNGTFDPCGNTTYGEVEDYSVNIKAPSFISAVAPAANQVGPGESKLIHTTFLSSGIYLPAGVYTNQLNLTSNDLANASVNIPCTMTVTVPGNITGVVTDGITGIVLPGVLVQVGSFSGMTNDDGVYSIYADAGSYPVVFTRIGYQTVNVASVAITTGGIATLNAQMFEQPYAPSCASATVNATDTEALVTWCVPNGPYELLYDDGSAENFAAWQLPGNMNAVKFTPRGYPATVVGAKLFVGDGSFPAGGVISGTGFGVAVYNVAASGMPGTMIDSVAASVTNYGWVDVTGLSATVTSGDFFIVMIQGTISPNCAPIGVDESVPKAYKSYSRNVGAGTPWVLSPYQDFMMHAVVSSPLTSDDDAMAVQTVVPGKVAGMISQNMPQAQGGITGMKAMVSAPEGYDNMDMVSKYSLSRIFLGAVTPVAPSAGVFTLINNALTATTYTDGGTTWAGLAQGWYAYGVKAIFPGVSQESPFVYTGVVPHKLFADVTVNVKLICGFVPAVGAVVTLTGQDYPNDSYTITVPASGTVFFDNVIVGKYDLTITKGGYTAYTMALTLTGNRTINAVLEDMRYVPRDLFVDDMTLVATWKEPLAFAVQEDFEGGVFPPTGWQSNTQGSVGWYATTDGGSAGFAIPAHTTYAVANDDEAGSANTGCCDYLITPELNLTNAPSYVLSFASYYTKAYGQLAYVEMSTDAGASWTPIYTLTEATTWQQLDIDLSAYSGTAGLASVWFAFHADDAGDWASGWAIDDVVIASGGLPVQGYGVFLDASEVGQTQELTWTYNPASINYGQTYVAGVAGLYCSGYSELDTYTFTSHFLYPPRNLEAVKNVSSTSGAVILTWDVPLGGDYAVSGSIPRTGALNPNLEYSPNVTLHTGNNTDAMWDVLFAYTSAGVSQAGVETDGNFIYTSVFNATTFYKYDLLGNLVESFSIPGVTSIRDLAYDGTYFYGSDATATLRQMDFTNKVLVSSITTGVSAGIRHIGYDPNLDGGNGGFWCGPWAGLSTIKMDGTLIQNVSSFNLASCYGTAVDPINNKVWFQDQGGNGADLWEFDAATLAFTGVTFDATIAPGFAAGIAGGLAYTNLVVSGTWVMLGLIQQAPTLIYGFDMGTAPPPVTTNLVGYHIFRNDASLVQVPTTPLEYWDQNLVPDTYCYDIKAVYDLTLYGFPGTFGESVKEGTACVDVNYGFNLPFTEDWTTGQFDVNLWTVGQNWIMDGQVGNTLPSAKFKWDPLLTSYSESLESFYMNAADMTTTTPYKLWLDFDLKLDDRTASTKEMLTIEVWNGISWNKVKEFANNGDFDWTNQHIDLSNVAKHKVFKVRFRANGDLSGDIFSWALDNIKIYVGYIFNPPLNLVAAAAATTPSNNDIKLTWSPPVNSGGTVMSYILDDGTSEGGVYDNASEGWIGNEFAVPDAGVLQSASVFLSVWAGAAATYSVDIFDASKTLIGSSALITPVYDDWATIALPDIPFNGTFYAMIHYAVSTTTDLIGMDQDGPNAAGDYEWYYDGSSWGKLSSITGFVPCVILVRATGLVGGKKEAVTFQAGSDPTNYVPSGNTLVQQPLNVNTGTEVAHATYLGDNSDAMMGYNVYRRAYAVFPAGQNTSAAGDWTKINTAVVSATEYPDNDLSNLVTNCYEYQVKAVYTEGESNPTNVDWECLFVGVKPVVTNEVSVYPNPATTYVRIDLTKEVNSFSIYNALGTIVETKTVKGETTFSINTNSYAAGAYSVKFTTSAGDTFSRKFVVTK